MRETIVGFRQRKNSYGPLQDRFIEAPSSGEDSDEEYKEYF